MHNQKYSFTYLCVGSHVNYFPAVDWQLINRWYFVGVISNMHLVTEFAATLFRAQSVFLCVCLLD